MISMRSASSCESRLREVVAREQVERHDRDAEVVAPLEELAHLRGAGAVAVGGGVVAELPRPAAVAVDHHRDVARHRCRVETAAQPVDVEPVEEAATELDRSSARPTLPLRSDRSQQT